MSLVYSVEENSGMDRGVPPIPHSGSGQHDCTSAMQLSYKSALECPMKSQRAADFMVRRSGVELNRGRLATPPHRAYGSVPRRFGGLGGKAVSMATKETAEARLRDAPIKRLVRADPPRSSRVYDGGESHPMRAIDATEFVEAPWSGRDIVSLLGALRHVAEHAVTSNGAYRPSLFRTRGTGEFRKPTPVFLTSR